MSSPFPPYKDRGRHGRDEPRHQSEYWSNEFMVSRMSPISEQESPSLYFPVTNHDSWNNSPDRARSPSFDRETSLESTQRQSSQWDMSSLVHNSHAHSHSFPMDEHSFYPRATLPPVHRYDLQPRSSTPNLPSRTLSRMPNLDRGPEHLQYSHLDPGMAGESWEVLDYLPPGFLKRSPAQIEAFRRLSREAQLDENQRRLVKCGWTDQGGLQSCTEVMSAKDTRKHIEKFHHVPRPPSRRAPLGLDCFESSISRWPPLIITALSLANFFLAIAAAETDHFTCSVDLAPATSGAADHEYDRSEDEKSPPCRGKENNSSSRQQDPGSVHYRWIFLSGYLLPSSLMIFRDVGSFLVFQRSPFRSVPAFPWSDLFSAAVANLTKRQR
ncbi:hypothetical protein C8J56DRAFT_1163908 [Mycena floridula]|nr:hypothetical protein C8J56DRAFT_1163908 [Mycena floridula]